MLILAPHQSFVSTLYLHEALTDSTSFCQQNVGAIVAGSIGAVVLLAVIGGVVIVFVRRRRRTTKALEFKEMKKEVPFENMPGQADMNSSHAVY